MSTLAAPAPTAAISLYFREGSSDKVYHAQIVPNGDDLYAVSFQYGRRGCTLQNGSKTAVPVTLAEARKIFDKLVAEKKAKGYNEGERGVPYSSGELANRRFEYTPQLLNFIDEPAMLECLGRPDWFMQEKMDGVRQIVECRAGNVTAGNRNGLTVAVSAAIVEAVFTLGHDCVLDGEATGDVYWPFDLLSFDGYDITQRSATHRLRLLTATLSAKPSNALGRVRSAFTDEAKRALLETIKTERGEGIVLKNANARYAPGRPASGGDALKHKFTGSATCSVVSHNRGKRSVLIAVHNDNDDASALRPLIEIGNVAISQNRDIPPPGSFVEVEYLYAFPGGALFQPVYKGPRADKTCPDSYTSLKFKQKSEAGTED
jgi:bifunctional non-homologous end joining protein LigD